MPVITCNPPSPADCSPRPPPPRAYKSSYVVLPLCCGGTCPFATNKNTPHFDRLACCISMFGSSSCCLCQLHQTTLRTCPCRITPPPPQPPPSTNPSLQQLSWCVHRQVVSPLCIPPQAACMQNLSLNLSNILLFTAGKYSFPATKKSLAVPLLALYTVLVQPSQGD